MLKQLNKSLFLFNRDLLKIKKFIMWNIFYLKLIIFMIRSLIKQIRNCTLLTTYLKLYWNAYEQEIIYNNLNNELIRLLYR